MSKNCKSLSLFDLYGEVIKGNSKESRTELLRRHQQSYPRHTIHESKESLENLRSDMGRKDFYHMLYLHLTR